jgi:hypothetical protein
MVGKPIGRIDRHKDGSTKAKGHIIIEVLTGYGSGSEKTAQRRGPDVLKTATNG